jgi:hypothetical protein
MIRKSNLQYLKHFFVVICITPLLAACGEDEPSPTPETSQSTGTVSFDIENSLGSGVGTTTSPAVVGIGDTLAMEISQKSSYTDAKTNQVFTCEPKAEIQIYAISDTIYANNIEDLTNVNSPQTSTSVINGECDTYHINQAFKIGTQEVDINLSYQAYKYTNSNGETVEMPYIKLNRAQSGMASSEKSRASGEAVAVTPTVTLRPISKSRTVSITETHEFEVTTRFSVALESVNTKSKNEQTLNFEVKYIAIVDEVTEYPDATNSLAYEFNLNNQAVSGTTFSLDKVSNFYVNQTSTYTAYNITSTTSPRAWVKLTAITDTIEVASVDEITKTKQVEGKEFAMTGENPKVYSLSKQFSIGKQNLEFELGYEAYSGTTLFEEPFEMPYYKLSDITQEAVSYKFLKNENYHDYYKVTAVYKVEMESVNTAQDKQTLSFEVNYLAFIDMVLEGITYDKEVKWEEAHDNLYLGFRPYVYRHRKFNNGMVVTDTIAGYNYSVVYMSVIGNYPGTGWHDIGYAALYRHRDEICNTDVNTGNCTKTGSFGVVGVDLDRLVCTDTINADNHSTNYIDINSVPFDEATAINGHWYSASMNVLCSRIVADPKPETIYDYILVKKLGLYWAEIGGYIMENTFYLPFLWIDGKKIEFDDHFERSITISLSDLTTSRYKKAKLVQFHGVMNLFGRDLHYEMTDTIYQWEGEVPEEYQKYVK